MKGFFTLLLLFITTWGFSQDISGIWRGYFVQGNGRISELFGYDDKYKFEVQISQKDKKISGVTYSYLTTVFYGKASCEGSVNPATRKVLLEELKLLEVKSQFGSGACIMTCFLQYNKVNGVEFLEGNYSSVSTRDTTNCGTGRVYLRKVENSDFYKEPFIVEMERNRDINKQPPVVKKTPPAVQPPVTRQEPDNKPEKPLIEEAPPKKQEPLAGILPSDTSKIAPPAPKVIIPKPKEISSRTNEVVKTIHVPKGTVTISLYDNGVIDNDTVSVFINNKLVISKQRLTDKPINFTIDIDAENEFHEVVMVADNLGDIPPNTSLMIVKAAGETYEVRITSTESSNAVVLFRLRK